jgi:hypothetical protein
MALALKADRFSMRDFDWLDGVGDRAPIVISRVSYTPKSILIIRDLFRAKMRFALNPSADQENSAGTPAKTSRPSAEPQAHFRQPQNIWLWAQPIAPGI